MKRNSDSLPKKTISASIPAEVALRLSELEAKVLFLTVELKKANTRIGVLEKENAELRALLGRCADFLSMTTANSNWPSSVMSSPLMQSGSKLLKDIRKVLEKEPGKQPDALEKSKPEETKAESEEASGKKKNRKSHPGGRQPMLPPDEEIDVIPGECPHCHGTHFVKLSAFIHQLLELPEVKIRCTHFRIWKCECQDCRKIVNAEIPAEFEAGFGPRFTAMIAELAGDMGGTRRNIERLVENFFGVPISQGAIENCIRRASEAILPHYEAALQEARQARYNHCDETSWRQFGPPGKAKHWGWVLSSEKLTVYKISEHRSSEAFKEFIGDWKGILISDDYKTYRCWTGEDRQTCLSHLIRKAEYFKESRDPEVAKGGEWVLEELRRLTKMAHTPPTKGQWATWKARFTRWVSKHAAREDDLGTFAKRLRDEAENLYTFLREESIDATNNRAERALRPLVVRRKVSYGSTSEEGERWVERVMTLRETCRQNGRSVFDELVKAISCHYRGEKPELGWIHEAGLESRESQALPPTP